MYTGYYSTVSSSPGVEVAAKCNLCTAAAMFGDSTDDWMGNLRIIWHKEDQSISWQDSELVNESVSQSLSQFSWSGCQSRSHWVKEALSLSVSKLVSESESEWVSEWVSQSVNSNLTCATAIHFNPHRYMTVPWSGVKPHISSVLWRVNGLLHYGEPVKVASE